MLDRLLGLASAASLLAGTVAGPSGPEAVAVFAFQDPQIVEGSGLVTDGRLFVTTNDSGDRGRIFTVDRRGRTVGTTDWSDDPTDVESLAPAGKGHVWVGDTGDNARARDEITVQRVPYGRGDRTVSPTSYRLVYPDRAHDAETLLADPTSGRLYVVTKDVFGGVVYAAPERLSADGPNLLEEVAPAVSVATDGSFFPDGRHVVIRGYTSATVYTYPGFDAVGSFRLPAQRQGEGISVGPDDALYLSTEGLRSEVLRMEVPADVAREMAPPTPSGSPSGSPSKSTSPTGSDAAADDASGADDDGRSPWPWLAAGAAFVGGAGWLLLRRGKAS